MSDYDHDHRDLWAQITAGGSVPTHDNSASEPVSSGALFDPAPKPSYRTSKTPRASRAKRRFLIYDATCTIGRPGGSLSHAWWGGATLASATGVFDATIAANSWAEALAWLVEVAPGEVIDEVQFWGHGKWGEALIGGEALSVESLVEGHVHYESLEALKANFGTESLWWFRTCETLGAAAGQEFARALAGHFECEVAGHTHVIGAVQSGLQRLRPGQEPRWSQYEGLKDGTPTRPRRAFGSSPFRGRTITCLRMNLPRWA